MRSLRLSLLLLPLLTGCASVTVGGEKEVSYESNAENNLRRGEVALANNNYEEAAQYFEYVRTTYPFLEAATTAELRLADVAFAQDEFASARERYQNFIQLHPTSPRVDYAAYRSAMTHYKDIPGDWFLIPSSREKDQGEVKSALSALREFIRSYPESQYVTEAQGLLKDVLQRLAEHELYVAEYYARRDKWNAVVLRMDTLLQRYPESGYARRALCAQKLAYEKLGEAQKAKEVLQRVAQQGGEAAGCEGEPGW